MQNFSHSKSKKSYSAILARWILGTIFLLSGVSELISIVPFPELSAQGGAFIAALKETNYLFIAVKAIETIGALMLLFNFFVPAALVLLAPVTLNILLFGIFLAPTTLPLAVIVVGLQLYLAWNYRALFMMFFKYQEMSHPWREDTAHLVVLEELQERYPKNFEGVDADEVTQVAITKVHKKA